MEDRSEPVGAESRVGTDSAIIENLDLLALVVVALVRNPLRIFGPGEARLCMGAIAIRLHRRLPAPTQRHLRG
jgi:hypothetical protein